MSSSLDPGVKKVFIVDDDVDYLNLTSKMLGQLGVSVETVTGGRKALEFLRTERPDIILLDALMPGVNGFEVCRTLRRDPATIDLKIIMCSVLGSGITSMLNFTEEPDAYPDKPFSIDKLVETINQVYRGN